MTKEKVILSVAKDLPHPMNNFHSGNIFNNVIIYQNLIKELKYNANNGKKS